MNFLYTYCLYHCIVTEKDATHWEEKGCKPRMLQSLLTDCSFVCIRGGGAGPAGLAKAGPLFRGLLVSFADCSDSLRTRRLGESPLLCVYAFLVIVHALLPVDQEPGAARTDCISTHAF